MTVNLMTDKATGGDGTDTFDSIEDVLGSMHDDTIVGDNNSDALSGWQGKDAIRGWGGNDVIHGNAVLRSTELGCKSIRRLPCLVPRRNLGTLRIGQSRLLLAERWDGSMGHPIAPLTRENTLETRHDVGVGVTTHEVHSQVGRHPSR